MDTESLQMLLQRLEGSTKLSEAGPPLALAHALQFVKDNGPEEDQEDKEDQEAIWKTILDRYETLGMREALDALALEGGVEDRGDIRIYSVFLNAIGEMVPQREPFVISLSIPILIDMPEYGELDENGLPKDLLKHMARSVHRARAERASKLADEIREQERQQ